MEEAELVFKRFPAEKQEQVRGLVNYATLMGLSGKDLVSIGGKLDRIKEANERKRNMEIVSSFECFTIGQDAKSNTAPRERILDKRFKLKTVNGNFTFESNYGSSWKVTSLATKVTKNINTRSYHYALPRTVSWERRSRYELLLSIADGTIQLNF